MPRLRHLLTLTLGAALLHLPLAQAAEELPEAIKKIEAKGAKIVGQFDAPDGLRGYAAQYQNRGMALYLTPDGKHVLLGNLYDADGNDLSSAPLQKLVYAPMSKEVWGKMEASNWIGDGNKDAPRVVYLFSDPNCPYCNMFWEQARPWVKAGKVQLRVTMQPNVHSILVEYRTGSGNWTSGGGFSSGRNIVVANLTPGTLYEFRVAFVGGNNATSEWSDLMTHMCA